MQAGRPFLVRTRTQYSDVAYTTTATEEWALVLVLYCAKEVAFFDGCHTAAAIFPRGKIFLLLSKNIIAARRRRTSFPPEAVCDDSNLEKFEDFKSLMFVDIYLRAYGIVCCSAVDLNC